MSRGSTPACSAMARYAFNSRIASGISVLTTAFIAQFKSTRA